MARRTSSAVGFGGIGAGVGAALAEILVHVLPSVEPVETAINVVLSAVLAIAGIWLAPRPVGEPRRRVVAHHPKKP